jgi:hypothetical protein
MAAATTSRENLSAALTTHLIIGSLGMGKADLLAMVFRRPTTPNGAGVHANRERRRGRLVLRRSNCYLIEISKRTVALFDHRVGMLITCR